MRRRIAIRKIRGARVPRIFLGDDSLAPTTSTTNRTVWWSSFVIKMSASPIRRPKPKPFPLEPTLGYSAHNGKGYADLIGVQVLFSPYATDAQQCHVEYVPRTNQLFLFTDAEARTRLPRSLTPGSAGTLANSQCTINGLGTTVVGSGPTLILNLSVTASPTFVGTRNIYMVAEDSATSTSGWQIRGTWTP